MASKKPHNGAAAEQLKVDTSAYLERLLCSHERFADALGTARARSARVADKFFELLLASQRDAIVLSKALVSQPAAYGKNVEAFLQSLSTAQERALELAKTVYREQTDAATEARAVAERAFAASKTLTQPFERLSGMWMPAAK